MHLERTAPLDYMLSQHSQRLRFDKGPDGGTIAASLCQTIVVHAKPPRVNWNTERYWSSLYDYPSTSPRRRVLPVLRSRRLPHQDVTGVDVHRHEGRDGWVVRGASAKTDGHAFRHDQSSVVSSRARTAAARTLSAQPLGNIQ
jgi:hypothetical protein